MIVLQYLVDLYHKYSNELKRDLPEKIVISTLIEDDNNNIKPVFLTEENVTVENVDVRLQELCQKYNVTDVGLWHTDLSENIVAWVDTIQVNCFVEK